MKRRNSEKRSSKRSLIVRRRNGRNMRIKTTIKCLISQGLVQMTKSRKISLDLMVFTNEGKRRLERSSRCQIKKGKL